MVKLKNLDKVSKFSYIVKGFVNNHLKYSKTKGNLYANNMPHLDFENEIEGLQKIEKVI